MAMPLFANFGPSSCARRRAGRSSPGPRSSPARAGWCFLVQGVVHQVSTTVLVADATFTRQAVVRPGEAAGCLERERDGAGVSVRGDDVHGAVPALAFGAVLPGQPVVGEVRA